MTNLLKAAEMALKLLEDKRLRSDEHLIPIIVDDLRQALAQPEQEHFCDTHCVHTDHHPDCKIAPPKREWVMLTDEEISTIDWKHNETLHDYARTIEAKLKEKNEQA